jgi:DNA repair protein RecN (Recombination protein N)
MLRLHLATAEASIERARDEIGAAVVEFRKAAALDASVRSILSDIEASESSIGEFVMDVVSVIGELDIDESELEQAEERFSTLSDLRRRYGPALDDVLTYLERSAERLGALDDLLDRADEIEGEIETAEAAVVAAGSRLMEVRRVAAQSLASEAHTHLRELGFSDPVVRAVVDPADPHPSGADRVSLLFASDRRLKPGEVGKVASGGELGRLVLALRLAGGAGDAPTLVFDEIDAGVGGATALQVGQKLAALAAHRQVLCVTHLPQVAAFADDHYVITRTSEGASIEKVEDHKRVEELSRMLAGLPDSDRGKEAAQELVALARQRRDR